MRQVVLISGRICNGKSSLADRLSEEFGYRLLRSAKLLKEAADQRKHAMDRLALQKLGDTLDGETDHKWLYDEFSKFAKTLEDADPVVVDNVRTKEQLAYFRSDRSIEVIHVHMYASMTVLRDRFAEKLRNRKEESASNYDDADLLKDLDDVEFFKRDADVRINTIRTDTCDNLVRVAARLRLYSPPNIRCVDVIVGAQYGSEGKGHISAYLAREYDVLVRVGGPNAGHTVSSSSGVTTYHQLPSGARDNNAELLLGPGMTLRVPDLLKEIKEYGIAEGRLFIDPQVMIIEDEDIEKEKELVSTIASTGRGGGAASARRILGRKPGAVRLARNVEELRPYVASTLKRLEFAYRAGKSILLEGTQGSGLSIFHGQYPYVTSRDTNVAGCLAEAGISPSRVRRILLVVRPTPIRVGDPDQIPGQKKETSGTLKHLTTFEEVATQAGLDPQKVVTAEKTSTTKRPRRVGWFEWDQFRQACSINAPTDIVLTFADYLSASNQLARRFEQLDPNTIKFIEELERVAQAPVSLINTCFPRKPEESIDIRTVIDRRNWNRP